MNSILNAVGLAWLVYIIAIIISWPVNVYQLTQCDFEAPHKCEVVHAVGLLPLTSPVVVWLDLGK
jgi:hypothetical protein